MDSGTEREAAYRAAKVFGERIVGRVGPDREALYGGILVHLLWAPAGEGIGAGSARRIARQAADRLVYERRDDEIFVGRGG